MDQMNVRISGIRSVRILNTPNIDHKVEQLELAAFQSTEVEFFATHPAGGQGEFDSHYHEVCSKEF